jgi:superoxide dismutase, Fe-Mn family
MDIRQSLSIIDESSSPKLERIKLLYSTTSLSPSMSKSLVELHYNKVYKEQVDNYNDSKGDKSFNEAGAYLHGIFFSQFKYPGTRIPTGQIRSIIEKQSKNYLSFKQDFKDACMSFYGSGWVYLSRCGDIKILRSQVKRTDIALLIDLWEHAYQTDYGTNKSKYIDNFWKIIDWDAVNRRL